MKLKSIFFALFLVIATVTPSDALVRLLFQGTQSGEMTLQSPGQAAGTVVLPILNDDDFVYLVADNRRILTTAPLTGGGSLEDNLVLGLDLAADITWTGLHTHSAGRLQIPNTNGYSVGLNDDGHPASCFTGEVFLDLGGQDGAKLFACVAQNTWQLQGGGGGTGGGGETPGNNYTASVDPTANNDVDEDYSAGSQWLNLAGNKSFWVMFSNADGAAVWARLDSGTSVLDSTALGVNRGTPLRAGLSNQSVSVDLWNNPYNSSTNPNADASLQLASNGVLTLSNEAAGDIIIQRNSVNRVVLDNGLNLNVEDIDIDGISGSFDRKDWFIGTNVKSGFNFLQDGHCSDDKSVCSIDADCTSPATCQNSSGGSVGESAGFATYGDAHVMIDSNGNGDDSVKFSVFRDTAYPYEKVCDDGGTRVGLFCTDDSDCGGGVCQDTEIFSVTAGGDVQTYDDLTLGGLSTSGDPALYFDSDGDGTFEAFLASSTTTTLQSTDRLLDIKVTGSGNNLNLITGATPAKRLQIKPDGDIVLGNDLIENSSGDGVELDISEDSFRASGDVDIWAGRLEDQVYFGSSANSQYIGRSSSHGLLFDHNDSWNPSVASNSSAYVLLDTNNNNTDSGGSVVFGVRKNGANISGSTQVLSIGEDGKLVLRGNSSGGYATELFAGLGSGTTNLILKGPLDESGNPAGPYFVIRSFDKDGSNITGTSQLGKLRFESEVLGTNSAASSYEVAGQIDLFADPQSTAWSRNTCSGGSDDGELCLEDGDCTGGDCTGTGDYGSALVFRTVSAGSTSLSTRYRIDSSGEHKWSTSSSNVYMLLTSDGDLLLDDGLSTGSVNSRFYVTSESAGRNQLATFEWYGDSTTNTNASVVSLNKSRAGSAVQSGDQVGIIQFRADAGTRNYEELARIEVKATENVDSSTDSVSGGSLSLAVVADGGTASSDIKNRFTIDGDGTSLWSADGTAAKGVSMDADGRLGIGDSVDATARVYVEGNIKSTTSDSTSHWIGRSSSHGLLFNQPTSYSPVLQSTTNVDVLVDADNGGGATAHSFNIKADALSGGDSELIASFGQSQALIKPNGSDGVVIDDTGKLSPSGTDGKIEANLLDAATSFDLAAGTSLPGVISAPEGITLALDSNSGASGARFAVHHSGGSPALELSEQGFLRITQDLSNGSSRVSSYPLLVFNYKDLSDSTATTPDGQRLGGIHVYGQYPNAGDFRSAFAGQISWNATEAGGWVAGTCSQDSSVVCAVDSTCPDTGTCSGGFCSNSPATSCSSDDDCDLTNVCNGSDISTDFFIQTAKDKYTQTRFVLYGGANGATSGGTSGIWTAGAADNTAGGGAGPGVKLDWGGTLQAYGGGAILSDFVVTPLVMTDGLVVDLDSANDAANNKFSVTDGGDDTVFSIDENGRLDIAYNGVSTENPQIFFSLNSGVPALNDTLGQIHFGGQATAGSTAVSGADISARASNSWSASDNDTDLVLRTTGGENGTLEERFVLYGDDASEPSAIWSSGDEDGPGVQLLWDGTLQAYGGGQIIADNTALTSVQNLSSESSMEITIDSDDNATTDTFTVSSGSTPVDLLSVGDDGARRVMVHGPGGGTPLTSGLLTIDSDDTSASQSMLALNLDGRDDSTGAYLQIARRRNSTNSASANDILFATRVFGWDGGSMRETARYGVSAGTDWHPVASGTASAGSKYTIKLIPDDVNSGVFNNDAVERFALSSNGATYLRNNNQVGVLLTTAGVLEPFNSGHIKADQWVVDSAIDTGTATIDVGDLTLTGSTIQNATTNGSITLAPSGTGTVSVGTPSTHDSDVSGTLKVENSSGLGQAALLLTGDSSAGARVHYLNHPDSGSTTSSGDIIGAEYYFGKYRDAGSNDDDTAGAAVIVTAAENWTSTPTVSTGANYEVNLDPVGDSSATTRLKLWGGGDITLMADGINGVTLDKNGNDIIFKGKGSGIIVADQLASVTTVEDSLQIRLDADDSDDPSTVSYYGTTDSGSSWQQFLSFSETGGFILRDSTFGSSDDDAVRPYIALHNVSQTTPARWAQAGESLGQLLFSGQVSQTSYGDNSVYSAAGVRPIVSSTWSAANKSTDLTLRTTRGVNLQTRFVLSGDGSGSWTAGDSSTVDQTGSAISNGVGPGISMDSSGTVEATSGGSLVADKAKFATRGSPVSVTATSTITADYASVALSSATNVTFDCTTFVPDGDDGQILIVVNANTGLLTLRDTTDCGATDTNLRLPTGNNLVLGQYDTVTLMFSEAVGDWLTVSTSNN